MKLLRLGKLNGGNILQPEVTGCHLDTFNKPAGKDIIWTSPLESNYGWKEWCVSGEMGLKELSDIPQEERWILELDESARVAKVDSLADLEALMARFPFPNGLPSLAAVLDWPNLARSYDAF